MKKKFGVVDKKIPGVTDVVTTIVLKTKFSEVENKASVVGCLSTTAVLLGIKEGS